MPTEYVIRNPAEKVVDRYGDKETAISACQNWNLLRDGTYTLDERHYNTVLDDKELLDPIMFNNSRDDDDQNSAETDDSNYNTMNYNFIANDTEQNNDETDFNTVGSMWTLGDHSSSEIDTVFADTLGDTMKNLDSEIDSEMMAVLEDAQSLIQNKRTTRFECPIEACGLGHSHSDHKHDIRAGFGVTESFAAGMEFCPYCHCGVNELSMLMPFYSYISVDVFEDDFSGTEEVTPTLLNKLYDRFKSTNGVGFNRLCTIVAEETAFSEKVAFPLGVRDDLEAFCGLRQNIENAANSAPIAGETRTEINDLRAEIEAVVE
jgi:hypothetical protein